MTAGYVFKKRYRDRRYMQVRAAMRRVVAAKRLASARPSIDANAIAAEVLLRLLADGKISLADVRGDG
ncbi:MAG: hypothetical protein WCD69_30330 [Xanthobacteraceae bacterium]